MAMGENLKGIIVIVAREYSRSILGEKRTNELLEECGLAGQTFLATKDYPNKLVFSFITLVGREQGMNMLQAVQAGGRYFASTYGPKNYRAFFLINNTPKKAFGGFQKLFSTATEGQEVGNYAAITTKWVDDDTVRIRYDSPLQNTAYPKGLAEGLGDYFGQKLRIRDLSNIEFEVSLRG
jgi:hypothetical protein